MKKETFDERVERLKEVNDVIKSLDPSIREASFEVLKNYITGIKTVEKLEDGEVDNDNGGEFSFENKEQFFSSYEHKKPSDNVMLITAYYYQEFGTSPILMDELKEIANSVGITVPTRPDMTLKKAQKKGKNLFTSAGRGRYQPTVHGEIYLKETYGVKKGHKKRDEKE